MEMYTTVRLEEIRRVFDFLEKAHDLMHQPLRYGDPQQVSKFVEDNYEEVKHLYYHTVRNWLPQDVLRKIDDE